MISALSNSTRLVGRALMTQGCSKGKPYHQLFHDSGSPLQPSKASIKYCIPQHSQFTAEEIKLQVAQVYRMNQWQRLNSDDKIGVWACARTFPKSAGKLIEETSYLLSKTFASLEPNPCQGL
nr:uncharacterized protein LOC105481706 isoform X2 [Macaca nemestrina]